ncbi:MAG: amidohydrolase family protein [Pseudomonadota bacterium]
METPSTSAHIPVIDSHVHAFPQPVFDAVKRWFGQHAWPFHDEGSIMDLIQAPIDNGLAGMVLMNYSHRPGISDFLNEFTGKLLKAIPRTVGLAAVHPRDENPREIIVRAFRDHGLCGVKMHCHVLKIPPDDPSMFPIYETALELGGVVNIHAGREPANDAYGVDVRAISGAARVERILKRYPELKLIIPHLGHDESDRFHDLLDEYPNLYLDTTMMLGGFFGVEVDRDQLVKNSERILFGTDYPHIPYAMGVEVDALLAMDLGEEVNRRILHQNARKVFPFS